jgi:acylpyruvate hydrolase
MKIICIGRNYAEHAKELNNPLPKEPVFFLKPDTALIKKNQAFYIPEFSNDIHHEVELVLHICKVGKNISEQFAHKYYDKITAGIDFTARDVQTHCKEKGLPWEKAKAFDGSAPIGRFLPITDFKERAVNFHLEVNEKKVQQGTSADMIFSFNKIISFVSAFFTLKIGDLIFTGTPAGVGKVNEGDKLSAFIEDLKVIEFRVK